MSVYSLTRPSEAALRMLIATGGSEQLILQRPANDLRANVRIDNFGGKPTAVISISSNTNSMTMQPDDGANAQHLADYIEALANGTADTAEFSNEVSNPEYVPQNLKPCCKCRGEALAYCYYQKGTNDLLHGVYCRYGRCQKVEDLPTSEASEAAWNAIQTEPLDEEPGQPADMVNHPPHYNGHASGVECIEVTELLSFNLGNAFKYTFRHRNKNGHEDLRKAEWYLKRDMERAKRTGLSIGAAQSARALAKRIAAHEPYPLGACLIAIADDQPEDALEWLQHLLAEA